MRFFMLSDLHLGGQTETAKAKEQLETLCSRIRADSFPGEKFLFIIMGDIINASHTDAFADARICLDCIRNELQEHKVYFEFIPGNHDLPHGDIAPFDRFIAEYGASCSFGRVGAFSRVYEGVNFIFADSTLKRNHRLPGELDIAAIKSEIKPMENLLFCHHGFTHSFGGDHDTIENGPTVLSELEKLGIRFAFHGHTHRADASILGNGICEIGCGSIFQNIVDMDGIQNQFSVGTIQLEHVVRVERFVVSKDGGTVFPHATLYPEQKTFTDPSTIGKCTYSEVPSYIPRKVLLHATALADSFTQFYSDEKPCSLFDALLKSEKVLLLSDAGQGKSVELEHLAHKLYHSPYYPFLFHLRNYTGISIETLLPPTYNHLSPSYHALLFDGYDELPTNERRQFVQQLNFYIEKKPGAHVLVSSRSNFCKEENGNDSKTFTGFKVYDLQALSNSDISSYLETQGINCEALNNLASKNDIQSLLKNPFYLTAITSLFKSSGTLPPKAALMDHLINTSFGADDGKFPADLEDSYHDIMNLLEAVSFSMQLLQQTQLDNRTEYQALFNTDNRKLLMHCGLLQKEGNCWRFSHNNFREYLTAKYLSKLSKEQVIDYISDGHSIKPSWVNTLGYLTSLTLSWDLLSWISEAAPNALVKFEPDRVDPSTRYSIFVQLFCKYEERMLFFHDELCTEEQLAHFAQSSTAISFLLERISSPANRASQYNAINILRHFSSLYDQREHVRTCLLDCCSRFPEISGDICRIAIFALQQLHINDADTTHQLISLFGACDDDYVRLGMYEYLIEIQEQDKYVNYFLDGIQYALRESSPDNPRVSNELFSLVEGLKSMSTPDSVLAVLAWFSSEQFIDFYDAADVFSVLVDKAAQLYLQGITTLYDVVLKCCFHSLREYDGPKALSCVRFFNTTNTTRQAIITSAEVLSEEEHLFSTLLDYQSDMFICVIDAYSDGHINNHKLFKFLINHHARDEITYLRCSEILYKRSGIKLPSWTPPVNYRHQRIQQNQAFFDALFSKEQLQELLRDLVECLASPDLLIGNLFDHHDKISWDSPLSTLMHAIYHLGNENWKVSDFFNCFDFDRFTIIETQKLIKSGEEIVITTEQKDYLESRITYWLSDGILDDEMHHSSERTTVSNFVYALIFLLKHFDISFPEHITLLMTSVPAFCFGDERESAKYSYLQSHLSLEKIKQQLEKNFQTLTLDPSLLRDHIGFCQENLFDIAVHIALEQCFSDSPDTWLRSASLDYLYTLYGSDYICQKVLPNVSGNFLLTVATKCPDIPCDILRERLEMEYSRYPTVEFMAKLIELGSQRALTDYVSQIEKDLRVPKYSFASEGPTKAIEKICDPVHLPLLGRLLHLLFTPGFIDADFFTLRSALMEALINCGKHDSKATISLLEKACLSTKSEQNIRFCNYIIQSISFFNCATNDQPMSLQEVQLILSQFNNYFF